MSKVCINDDKDKYTGSEFSPLGRGLSPNPYKIGTVEKGTDHRNYIVSIVNGVKVWYIRDKAPKSITLPEPLADDKLSIKEAKPVVDDKPGTSASHIAEGKKKPKSKESKSIKEAEPVVDDKPGTSVAEIKEAKPVVDDKPGKKQRKPKSKDESKPIEEATVAESKPIEEPAEKPKKTGTKKPIEEAEKPVAEKPKKTSTKKPITAAD